MPTKYGVRMRSKAMSWNQEIFYGSPERSKPHGETGFSGFAWGHSDLEIWVV